MLLRNVKVIPRRNSLKNKSIIVNEVALASYTIAYTIVNEWTSNSLLISNAIIPAHFLSILTIYRIHFLFPMKRRCSSSRTDSKQYGMTNSLIDSILLELPVCPYSIRDTCNSIPQYTYFVKIMKNNVALDTALKVMLYLKENSIIYKLFVDRYSSAIVSQDFSQISRFENSKKSKVN